jgi:hypothetical protein
MMRVLLAVLLLGVSSVSFGAFMSGHELQAYAKECDKYRAGQETEEYNRACQVGRAYVAGVFDLGETLISRWVFEKRVCPPDDVSRNQLVTIVRKYMDDHPEQMDFAAAGLIYDSLVEAYPCE